jgi:hypothetical protein
MEELNATIKIYELIEAFEMIKLMRLNIAAIFTEIKGKIEQLNNIYIDIVKSHKIKEYTFGLDSFHFQNKIIEIEYDNMNNLLNTLLNRFYCEYYKLYKIIGEYINEINNDKLSSNCMHKKDFSLNNKVLFDYKKDFPINKKDFPINKKDFPINKKDFPINKKDFPVYKDLDKNINYDFELTIEIQRIIVAYINDLSDYLQSKNIELKNNTTHTQIGINIENIVNYQYFSNAVINERISMFIRYLNALNKHHTKYIKRLYNITMSLLDHINDELHINNNTSSKEAVLQSEALHSEALQSEALQSEALHSEALHSEALQSESEALQRESEALQRESVALQREEEITLNISDIV